VFVALQAFNEKGSGNKKGFNEERSVWSLQTFKDTLQSVASQISTPRKIKSTQE
jgi:hypothetical protein